MLFLALSPFQDDLTEFRSAFEERLKSPTGWLAVTGLHWLSEGAQSLGPNADISLRTTSRAILVKRGNTFSLILDGATTALKPDETRFKLDDLTLMVIQRGKRTGLRVWDPESEARKAFQGCKWFAPSETYRIEASFTPHPKGKTIPITNILGDTEPQPNPGYVTFELGRKQCRLEAIAEGDGLFFNFKDLTNGEETYMPGRFLNTAGPKDGKVILDFNRAVNPPCSVTAFATCPLPPKGNELPVRIEAGQLKP